MYASEPGLGRALALSILTVAIGLAATLLPLHAAAQAPAQSSGDAVASFGDEQLAAVARLVQSGGQPAGATAATTLRDRVGAAVRIHPQALAADASQRAAAEATRLTQAQALPQLSISLDGGPRKTDASTVFDTPKRHYDSASAAVTLRQTLFDQGANKAAVEAGRERESAIAWRAENRRADLAVQAVQAWAEVLRQRERLRLSRLNVQALEQMLDFLRRREALGAGTQSDVWRAQARLADARGALASGEARVISSEAAFREAFGAEPGELQAPLPPAYDRNQLREASNALVLNNAALRSAEAARQSSEYEREAVDASEKPQVSVELNAARRDIVGAGKPGNDVSALAALRYNFYSGGADDARRAQARHRVTEAAEQARGVRMQVERALAQSLAEEAAGDRVLAARREAATQAALALRAVRELFANRRGTLLELLAAQDGLHGAALQLIDAEAETVINQWRLLYFDDRIFAPALGLDRAPQDAPRRP